MILLVSVKRLQKYTENIAGADGVDALVKLNIIELRYRFKIQFFSKERRTVVMSNI